MTSPSDLSLPRGRRLGRARMLVLVTGLSALYAWWLGALPIGHFWWDWLSLIGAALARKQQLVPFTDYWTTFLFPIALTELSLDISGIGRSFMILHAFQLAFAYACYWAIARSRLSRGAFAIGALFLWVACFAPFNYSHTGTNLYNGLPPYWATINFNAFYNRFAVALMMIVYIFALPAQKERNIAFETAALTATMLALFWTKISAFYIAVYLAGAAIVINRGSPEVRAILVKVLILFVAILTFQEIEGSKVSSYLAIIDELSRFKAGTFFRDLTDFRIEAFLALHRRELPVFLLIAGIVAIHGIAWLVLLILRGRTASGGDWTTAFLAVHLGAFALANLLNSFTSYGDQGLLPIYAAVFLTLDLLRRSAGAGAIAPRWLGWFDAWALGGARWLSLAATLGFAAYFVAMTAGIGVLKVTRRLERLNTGTPVIDNNFTVEKAVAARASVLRAEDRRENRRGNFFEPEDFHFLAYQYGHLSRILERHRTGDQSRILMLSLPSLLPPMLVPSRSPHGAYSWLHIKHEFSTNNPPPIEAILSRADLVVRDLCEPNESNRDSLFELFRPHLEQRALRIVAEGCWEIYARKH